MAASPPAKQPARRRPREAEAAEGPASDKCELVKLPLKSFVYRVWAPKAQPAPEADAKEAAAPAQPAAAAAAAAPAAAADDDEADEDDGKRWADGDGSSELFIDLDTAIAARDAARAVLPPGSKCVVHELQLLQPLHVLLRRRGVEDAEWAAAAAKHAPGADGVQCGPRSFRCSLAALRHALRLVDADKHKGLSQAFISDMFSRMSLH